MTRLAAALVAIATLLLPVLTAVGHTESELEVSLVDQEIVITGHDAFDPVLHIEKSAGVRVRHCPECVLDKRSSTAAPAAGTIFRPRPADRHVPEGPFERVSLEVPSHRSPRAPPRA